MAVIERYTPTVQEQMAIDEAIALLVAKLPPFLVYGEYTTSDGRWLLELHKRGSEPPPEQPRDKAHGAW